MNSVVGFVPLLGSLVLMCGVIALARNKPQIQKELPGILLSLGVLGTFAGICYGLFQMDISADDSIPDLLDGMKTAFWSSVLGMALSIFYRWKNISSIDPAETQDMDTDDLIRDQTKVLQSLKHAIAGTDGTEESTLMGQLKQFRIDHGDGVRKITTSMDEFARTLAESNTDAFMQALEDAIRDFNDKLAEQFGENFAQLNEAVGKLLDWQAEYRVQLSTTVDAFHDIRGQLEVMGTELGEVAKQTESLAQVSDRQNTWLEAQISSQTDLEARLQAFADMAEKAQTAVPEMDESLRKLISGLEVSVNQVLSEFEGSVNGFEAGVSQTTEKVNSLVDEFSTGVNETQDQVLKISTDLGSTLATGVSQTTEKVNSLVDEFSTGVNETQDQVLKISTDLGSTLAAGVDQTTQQIESTVSDVGSKMVTHLTQFDDQLAEHHREHMGRMEQSVEKLDEALAEELQKSLQSLSNNLRNLSTRFVDDYTPLTNQLREVVRLSEGVVR